VLSKCQARFRKMSSGNQKKGSSRRTAEKSRRSMGDSSRRTHPRQRLLFLDLFFYRRKIRLIRGSRPFGLRAQPSSRIPQIFPGSFLSIGALRYTPGQ
jgi:hypothetical protein